MQLSILPTGSLLQAELFVPTRAVGFVRSGQQVRILYDAFPYQRFGSYGGRIIALTRTILTPTDDIGPIALSEPAYKATVALDRRLYTIEALRFEQRLEAVEWWVSAVNRDYVRVELRGEAGLVEGLVFVDRNTGKRYFQGIAD